MKHRNISFYENENKITAQIINCCNIIILVVFKIIFSLLISVNKWARSALVLLQHKIIFFLLNKGMGSPSLLIMLPPYYAIEYNFVYIKCPNSKISLKKGAQIKSYLISHALITAGFKI